MTERDSQPTAVTSEKCDCHSDDAYDCWASRYDLEPEDSDARSIEAEGGPCQCVCHDASLSKEERVECYVCHQTGDLRPYGPKGAMICFPCMKSDPEREAEAHRQFGAQIDACGPIAILDGSNTGPRPPMGKRS